jgi:hypothetical protein
MGMSDSAGRGERDPRPYDPWESDADASDDMASDLVDDSAAQFVPPAPDPTAGSPRFDPDRLSLIALIASNFLAIAIAWVMGWSTVDVIIFYWIENLIIGFWTILRILFAQGGAGPIAPPPESDQTISDGLAYMRRMQGSPGRPMEGVRVGGISPQSIAEKLFVIPFFCFHYYMFCLVHGVFIQVFTTIGESGFGPSVTTAFNPFDFTSWRNPIFTAEGFSLAGALAVMGIFISHGVSFFQNYIGRGEYLDTSTAMEMGRPYVRVVLLHVCIIFGGFAVMLFGSPLGLVLLFMIAKTILDVKLHRKIHRSDSGAVF